MKNIVRKILLEFAETTNEDQLTKLEITILKDLTKKGFKPTATNRNKILNYLSTNLGFDFKESMELYSLFKNNYSESGDYEFLEKVKRGYGSDRALKSTNKDAKDLVKSKIPFKGSNTTGEWIGNSYVVKSYGWYPIFVFKNNQWYENSKRYSMSTGRQMSHLRPTYETIPLTKDELNDLIYDKN
jgi:hypothetical protein